MMMALLNEARIFIVGSAIRCLSETENFTSNENRAIKKSMTPGDVLTKNKVLRKRSPRPASTQRVRIFRNRYYGNGKETFDLTQANKKNMYLHNANEYYFTLFMTFGLTRLRS